MRSKILIVDDHSIVRLGVEIILREKLDDLDFSQAESFTDCIDLINKDNFDLIILDINLPDGENTAMIDKIKSIHPTQKILVLSAHEEASIAAKYIRNGANGYVSKLADDDKIFEAVNQILNGNSFYSDEIKIELDNFEFFDVAKILSSRELQVAKMYSEGFGNLEIANKLNIKMSTVSTYKLRVFEKLNITNIIDLANLVKDY